MACTTCNRQPNAIDHRPNVNANVADKLVEQFQFLTNFLCLLIARKMFGIVCRQHLWARHHIAERVSWSRFARKNASGAPRTYQQNIYKQPSFDHVFQLYFGRKPIFRGWAMSFCFDVLILNFKLRN